MPSPRRTSVLLALALLSGSGIAATAEASAPAEALTRLGSPLLPLSVMKDEGAVPANRELTITLDLQRPDPAGEAAFVDRVEDLHSGVQPLSVDQFAARFGVQPSVYAKAVAYATREGLTVTFSSPARDHLVLSGTARQVEQTFSTPLHTVSYAGRTVMANTLRPLVPAEVPVLSVLGLETWHRAHLDQDVCSGGECTGDVTPQDLWSIYDQPAADTGKGQKLTIFGEGATAYVIADLRQFEKENKLRQIPVKVNLADGKDHGQYTSKDGDGEWQLDTQSSSGMAFNADELDMDWGVDLNDASTLNVLQEWLTDKKGSYAASASYSECEPTVGDIGGAEGALPASAQQLEFSTDAYTKTYEQGLTEATALGKTLFSSSGDTGSSCGALPADLNGVTPTEGTPGVGYPGSSPHAVDVGGTVLYGTENNQDGGAATHASNAKRFDEYGWTSSGGGPSEVFPAPKYQAKVIGSGAPTETPDVPCETDLTGAPSTSLAACRKLPDVSAISGDIVTNGYSIVDDKADTATGGTSLSSPVMLGMWTRVQSAVGGKGLGYANPFFYAHAKDFFDPGAATGAPYTPAGSTTPSTNGFVSGPGFDYVTGLGVMDVAAFIKDVAPKKAVTKPVTVTAPTKPVTKPGTKPVTTPTPVATGTLPTTGLTEWPVALGLLLLVSGAFAVRRRVA